MKTRCECLELPFVKLMAYARRYNIMDIEELLKTGKLRCGDRFIKLPKVDVPLDIPPPRHVRDD